MPRRAAVCAGGVDFHRHPRRYAAGSARSRSELNDALKEGGRGDATVGVGTRRLLIICEVALSLVLLMGAGVMVQSLLALRQGDVGFDPKNVLTMSVRLVHTRYPTPAQRAAFFDAVVQRIRALPGVEAAGTIDDLPFDARSSQTLLLEGYAPQRDPAAVQARQITPGYLRAMKIPLLQGRDVVESDSGVMLVSGDAAKLYWGSDDPIGRRAALPFSKTVLRRVVGIVGDVKQRNLIDASTPTVYFYTREPGGSGNFHDSDFAAALHARTARRRGHSRDRSRAAGITHPDYGAGDRWRADVATLQCSATRNLCRNRAASRRSRNLQRTLLHRAGTEPRDRDQNCTWCAFI